MTPDDIRKLARAVDSHNAEWIDKAYRALYVFADVLEAGIALRRGVWEASDAEVRNRAKLHSALTSAEKL